MPKTTLLELIERSLSRSPEQVFVRRDFASLGGQGKIGRALRAAVDNGLLVKVGYGVYARARPSSLTGKPIPVVPLVEVGMLALSKLGVKARLGKSAKAYAEGRTTQMPVATVLSVGKSRVRRRIGFGGRTIRYER